MTPDTTSKNRTSSVRLLAAAVTGWLVPLLVVAMLVVTLPAWPWQRETVSLNLQSNDQNRALTRTGVWHESATESGALLLISGSAGDLPGTRSWIRELNRAGFSVLRYPMPDAGQEQTLLPALSWIRARVGEAPPITLVAVGEAAPAALRLLEQKTVASVVLLDPDGVGPARTDGSFRSLAILSAGLGPEDAGTQPLRELYETVSGEDARLLPPAEGAGLFRPFSYLSPDGTVLLSMLPSVPRHTGLLLPVYRDTAVRWLATDTDPLGTPSGFVLPVLPLLTLAALAAGALCGVLVRSRVMELQRRGGETAGLLPFLLVLLPVAGLLFRWTLSQPLLTWQSAAASALLLLLLLCPSSVPDAVRAGLSLAAALSVSLLAAALSGVLWPGWLAAAAGALTAWGYARIAAPDTRYRYLPVLAQSWFLLFLR